jgi:RNA polymerase sigma factor (sigma-70 family)
MPSGSKPHKHDLATTLISRCLDGDERAWEQLVHQYSRLVYSIAYKSGLSDEDAADLVQNVFTIVLRRLESLQHVERFSAWLITVAHRESWRLRRSRQESTLEDDHDPADASASLDALVVEWEHASIVHDALQELGGRCRALIERLFLRDPRPSYESIAADLGIAVGSIGPIRGRCLRQLRDALETRGLVDARS